MYEVVYVINKGELREFVFQKLQPITGYLYFFFKNICFSPTLCSFFRILEILVKINFVINIYKYACYLTFGFQLAFLSVLMDHHLHLLAK